MNYRIEYFDNYAQQWEPVGDNHLNQWPTLEAAEDSIKDLKECGEDWSSAEYRIIEQEPTS
jgi:hypothetical protein